MESGHKPVPVVDFEIILTKIWESMWKGNGWGTGYGAITPSLNIREGLVKLYLFNRFFFVFFFAGFLILLFLYDNA